MLPPTLKNVYEQLPQQSPQELIRRFLEKDPFLEKTPHQRLESIKKSYDKWVTVEGRSKDLSEIHKSLLIQWATSVVQKETKLAQELKGDVWSTKGIQNTIYDVQKLRDEYESAARTMLSQSTDLGFFQQSNQYQTALQDWKLAKNPPVGATSRADKAESQFDPLFQKGLSEIASEEITNLKNVQKSSKERPFTKDTGKPNAQEKVIESARLALQEEKNFWKEIQNVQDPVEGQLQNYRLRLSIARNQFKQRIQEYYQLKPRKNPMYFVEKNLMDFVKTDEGYLKKMEELRNIKDGKPEDYVPMEKPVKSTGKKPVEDNINIPGLGEFLDTPQGQKSKSSYLNSNNEIPD